MNNDAVRELLNAVGALAEMSLNFYRALLNAGATKEEAFVLLQSFTATRRKVMKTEKKNLRRISIVVTAQTKGNLERLAAVCGYSEIGRVVDKLTREKMISLHNFERKERYHE